MLIGKTEASGDSSLVIAGQDLHYCYPRPCDGDLASKQCFVLV